MTTMDCSCSVLTLGTILGRLLREIKAYIGETMLNIKEIKPNTTSYEAE